jgi:hypothetical protein
VYSGGQSLRIRYVNAAPLGSSVAQYLPLEMVRGRHVRFSGYLKTDSTTQGECGTVASLEWGVQGPFPR